MSPFCFRFAFDEIANGWSDGFVVTINDYKPSHRGERAKNVAAGGRHRDFLRHRFADFIAGGSATRRLLLVGWFAIRWGERLSRRSLAKADPREPARQ